MNVAHPDPQTGVSLKDTPGFSLIEFLIASTILLVISLPLFRTLNEIRQTAVNQAEAHRVLDNTRVAMETVRRLVQVAGNDPNRIGFDPVTIASPTEIRIRSDRTGSGAPGEPDKGDPDGDIGDSGENLAIRYNNAKERLEMIHGGGAVRIIADTISSFSVQGFDADGDSAAAGARICTIVVTISGTGRPKPFGTGKQFGIKLTGTIRIQP